MTITEQKAFLRSYTGQAQAPADFAQRWQETVAALHPAVSCAPVAFGNPCGVYERLTVTFDGRSVTARVIRPAADGVQPLLLMYHDLNRGVRGWHHITRFLALGFGVVIDRLHILAQHTEHLGQFEIRKPMGIGVDFRGKRRHIGHHLHAQRTEADITVPAMRITFHCPNCFFIDGHSGKQMQVISPAVTSIAANTTQQENIKPLTLDDPTQRRRIEPVRRIHQVGNILGDKAPIPRRHRLGTVSALFGSGEEHPQHAVQILFAALGIPPEAKTTCKPLHAPASGQNSS